MRRLRGVALKTSDSDTPYCIYYNTKDNISYIYLFSQSKFKFAQEIQDTNFYTQAYKGNILLWFDSLS